MKRKNRNRSMSLNLSRELQAIPLLSQEAENVLCQAMESHLKAILGVLTEIPISLDIIQSHLAEIAQGKLKLDSLLRGFKSEDPPRLEPDLPEAQKRLFKLSILQYEAQGALQNFGPDSPKTKDVQHRLIESLSNFKWTAQIIEQLVHHVQSLIAPKKTRIYQLQQKLEPAFTAFKQAKEAMAAVNLRLVVSIAKRYAHYGVPFLDLFQEGNVGLVEAIERFDYRWGYAFSNYAVAWIERAILKAIAKQRPYILLEKEDVLESAEEPETSSPFTAVSAQELLKLTEKALSKLRPREAKILRLRFGIGTHTSYSLKEIAELFEISPERIRQIEAKALRALRKQMDIPSLKPFLKD